MVKKRGAENRTTKLAGPCVILYPSREKIALTLTHVAPHKTFVYCCCAETGILADRQILLWSSQPSCGDWARSREVGRGAGGGAWPMTDEKLGRPQSLTPAASRGVPWPYPWGWIK